MRIESLKLKDYLSVHDEELSLGALNVLIGANASGKSNVVDALRFLRDVLRHDFGPAVSSRGGFLNLACKASTATRMRLAATFEDVDWSFKWSVVLARENFGYAVREEVHRFRADTPPQQILLSWAGEGWWWSGDQGRVTLRERRDRCALAAAAADASFPARAIAAFVRGWGFRSQSGDTAPSIHGGRVVDLAELRTESGRAPPRPEGDGPRAMVGESSTLRSYGQNLAARLHALKETDRERFERVHSATRDILGVPEKNRIPKRPMTASKEPAERKAIYVGGCR